MDQTQQFNSAYASLTPEQQATYQKANPTVNVGGATQTAGAGGYTPSPNTFSITPTNANGAVTSDALAKTDATYGSVLNYRKNLQDAYDTYTKNSTAIQNDINSSLSMSPEEQAAQKSLADIQNKELATNVDARRRQDEIRKNENGLFGGGLQNALVEDARKSDAQLADIAVQRFAASNTLQALTGVRTSKLDALKTKLGFEDTRFEKLLGIEQEFRGMTKDEKAQARTDLSTILEYSNGLDWNELTPQAQQSITNAVANTNLSLDAVKQSLARNKIAYTEERTKNRLANQLTQSNINKNNAEARQKAAEDQIYSGLGTATASAVKAKVNQFKTEQTITNFSTVQDGYNFAKSLSTDTKNPADDQALIYSLAKALDPNSVVREGEYATAQKYAQSWINAYGKGITQAIAGTGFLSKDARENIKKTIEAKFTSTKKSYENTYSKYVDGINNLTGRKDGAKFIIDYATDSQTTPNIITAPDGQQIEIID